jgi:hypothetical protein
MYSFAGGHSNWVARPPACSRSDSNRWNWLLASGLVLAWIVPTRATDALKNQPAAPPVVVLLRQPQLFIDDHLIARSQGLKRSLHRPVKDRLGQEPVIATPPGCETLLAKGTILYDPHLDRYVMFAKARPSTRIHRFVSRDGLEWRPEGLNENGEVLIPDEEPMTGKVLPRQYAGMHCFFYDARDAQYPYKGWCFFGNWGEEGEGAYYIRSRDGLRWERRGLVVPGWAGPGDGSAQVIRQGGRTVYGPGDTTRFAWDPVEQRFLGIFKFFTTDRVGPDNALRSRAYAFFERLDEPFNVKRIEHVDLLPPAADTGGDRAADEYYASTAWRYGSLWLGELLVWHGRGDYPYSAAGCAFTKLISSRDGLHWTPVPFVTDDGPPALFIPNGKEGGNGGRNDGGYMSLFSQGPLRIGNELVFYYAASSFGKNHPPGQRITGGGIFRARLRPDGFVSVDAGELTTPPLVLPGGELVVNSAGPVEVELLSAAADKRLSGAKLEGDALRHQVHFEGLPSFDFLSQQRLRLRFRVGQAGRLYSFSIEPPDA